MESLYNIVCSMVENLGRDTKNMWVSECEIDNKMVTFELIYTEGGRYMFFVKTEHGKGKEWFTLGNEILDRLFN